LYNPEKTDLDEPICSALIYLWWFQLFWNTHNFIFRKKTQ